MISSEHFAQADFIAPHRFRWLRVKLKPSREALGNPSYEDGRTGRGSVSNSSAIPKKSQSRRASGQKQEIAEKITQGLNSLRRGEAVDGESVFDRIDAEVDELERADHK